MKQLQNNFTTPEQAKRLLALGLPADSADCFTANPMECLPPIEDLVIFVIDRDETYTQRIDKICENGLVKHSDYLPCWSFGRLMEIELTCREHLDGYVSRLQVLFDTTGTTGIDQLGSVDLMENLISYMEKGLFRYDFSKLEDKGAVRFG